MACAFLGLSVKDFASCISYAVASEGGFGVETWTVGSSGVDIPREGCVWFLTGYGKSVCYQALPFMFDNKLGRSVDRNVVLVVSPLVSLMIDQVTSLRSVGVGAAIMSAGQAGGQLTKEQRNYWWMREMWTGSSAFCLVPQKQLLGQRGGVSCC